MKTTIKRTGRRTTIEMKAGKGEDLRGVMDEFSTKPPAIGMTSIGDTSFQQNVVAWLWACFGPTIAGDKLERGDRFLEEALELLQSGDYPRERIAALTSYVYGRPKGQPGQEVGGVMVTLASYCYAHDLDMQEAGSTELARVWTKIDAIRAKQAAKPTGSALPIAQGEAEAAQERTTIVEALEALTKAVESINPPTIEEFAELQNIAGPAYEQALLVLAAEARATGAPSPYLSLEIGKTYLTADGRRVKITGPNDDPRYPFWSDQGYPYPPNGRYFLPHVDTMGADLVAVAPEQEGEANG